MNRLKTGVKVIFAIFVVLIMVVLGGVSAVYYENWERDAHEGDSKVAQFLAGKDTKVQKELKPNFTCLFMGRNQHLTDFIMLGQYNPNTREVALLSIPRDTYVGTTSIDGKINSIYMNKYPEKVVAKVEEITGVEIDHYLVFDAKILRNIVNELGGVTVDVPINMDYDDPYQDLYIHLKKGTQRLTGAQAEQFVRFRKNNNGTGYANGDIGRIATQHQFIKAMVSEVLKPENIGKIGNLVKIALNGTKTDITTEIIEEYLNDVITFKSDRMRIETLPGVGRSGNSPNGYVLSFFYHDAAETKKLVQELFFGSIDGSGDIEDTENLEISGEVVENMQVEENDISTAKSSSGSFFEMLDNVLHDKSGEENGAVEASSESLMTETDTRIRLEVLNANAKSTKLNSLVENLNNNNCNVVKIGNYATTKVETSRIITYGTVSEENLKKVKELSGIKKVEESTEKSNVEFTIIIGANY